MQGRNTVEEVLCLSAEKGYTIFYRNGENSNVLSDIVVAHPTSIAMIRTWPYFKYYSGLIVQHATIRMCRDDSNRHIDQNMLAKLTEMVKDEEVGLTSQVLHFGVETTNRAESEHSSHGLPCACELVNRCQHLMPIQEEDVIIFWRKLEIGSDIPEEHHRDMESEMLDLTSLL
ncbi:hypothetical protein M9H77_07779 [Catharanthus roseus]|uniref:Uncharacterized protein n=1 Tax=Catharanthus roseus TaxID=4058 RepID=A0ACC0BW68_CATRO|nr:hypothetical protein M9H77_07779 [Catharanthus roseus]